MSQVLTTKLGLNFWNIKVVSVVLWVPIGGWWLPMLKSLLTISKFHTDTKKGANKTIHKPCLQHSWKRRNVTNFSLHVSREQASKTQAHSRAQDREKVRREQRAHSSRTLKAITSFPGGESFTWTGETSNIGMRPGSSKTWKGEEEKCTEAERAV